jgi:TolB-like protein/Tfp pilus assembly protein PilF
MLSNPIFNLDNLILSRYSVVGDYVRFDNDARHLLKDFRQKLVAGFAAPPGGSENFLIWGPPGSGKTYFVQEIAHASSGVTYIEINLAESNEGSFRSSVDKVESLSQDVICLIDEVDAKAGEPWPYELLLRHLEPPTKRSKHVSFVLAGSSGRSLQDVADTISSRPKGIDLLSRIPASNRLSVPPLGDVDRLLVAVTQLMRAAAERGKAIHEVEKMAAYYMIRNTRLQGARQLRDFALECARRIPQGEDRVKYDDLFQSGDPENKAFWMRTQHAHNRLVNSYLTVDMGERVARPPKSTEDTSRRIAVLPFSSISPDAADEYFADGMTEELISTVSKISDLRTTSRTSAMRYKGTTKPVGEIAKDLQVGAVLEGSVRKAGNRLRINVLLINVQRDEQLWSQTYDRELEDVFAIQSEIANKVAEALQVHLLADEKKRIEKAATTNMKAYTLYLKGLHFRAERTQDGYQKAIHYFEDALTEDPKLALAYAAIAECYERLGEEGYMPPGESFPKAQDFAKKALELDDTIAEAHATLGAVYESFHYDQPAAEDEFRRALSFNPNYGRVCNSYGAHLACMGRMDEAVREIGRAQQLNPLALEVNDCAAVIFNCVDQFDRSLDACERMFRIDENYFPAYQDLAEAYLEKSRYDDAIEVLRKAVVISKGAATVKARLGLAYARAGRIEEANAMLLELEEDSKQKYVTPIAMALINCGLNNKEAAIAWLEKACEERAGGLLSVNVRPMWAGLRSEPAFIRLVNRLGLNSTAVVRS